MAIEVLSLERQSLSNFVAMVRINERIEKFEFTVTMATFKNQQQLRTISGDQDFCSYARTSGSMEAAMYKLVWKVCDGENLSFPIKLELE